MLIALPGRLADRRHRDGKGETDGKREEIHFAFMTAETLVFSDVFHVAEFNSDHTIGQVCLSVRSDKTFLNYTTF